MDRGRWRFIRNIIYELKKLYPTPITIYRPSNNSIDLDTGKMSQTIKRVWIRKAVVMPTKDNRIQALMMFNPDFKFGGMADKERRTFLIDMNDFRELGELTPNDWIVYNHRRYEIKQIHKVELNEVVAVLADYKFGSIPYEIQIPCLPEDVIKFMDVVTHA